MVTIMGWRNVMVGMFDKKVTNPEIIRKLKLDFAENFQLPESAMISIAELRCHEPGCPPVETVITARFTDGKTKDWRISKSASEIKHIDITMLHKDKNGTQR